jgi:hypothetical protein
MELKRYLNQHKGHVHSVMWKPRTDETFACGFNAPNHNFAQYVAHITLCAHRTCIDRLRNHESMKAYFLNRAGR